MSTPNVTQAQVVAFLASIVSAAIVLFKLNVSDQLQAEILGSLTLAVAVAWPIADSIVRHGRATKAAAEANLAAAQVRRLPADGDDSTVDPAPPASK